MISATKRPTTIDLTVSSGTVDVVLAAAIRCAPSVRTPLACSLAYQHARGVCTMETQHVLKKSAIGFRIFAVDDYRGAINHNYLQKRSDFDSIRRKDQ